MQDKARGRAPLQPNLAAEGIHEVEWRLTPDRLGVATALLEGVHLLIPEVGQESIMGGRKRVNSWGRPPTLCEDPLQDLRSQLKILSRPKITFYSTHKEGQTM